MILQQCQFSSCIYLFTLQCLQLLLGTLYLMQHSSIQIVSLQYSFSVFISQLSLLVFLFIIQLLFQIFPFLFQLCLLLQKRLDIIYFALQVFNLRLQIAYLYVIILYDIFLSLFEFILQLNSLLDLVFQLNLEMYFIIFGLVEFVSQLVNNLFLNY